MRLEASAVPRRTIHERPADDVAARPERPPGLRAVEPVPVEALERLDQPPVVVVEPLGSRDDRRPCELGEELPLPRRVDVERVEEGRDRVVIPGEQSQPLERVVVRLRETACVVVP